MKIIGHRGAAALAPENTLASIKAASDAGVDLIEVDVRVTADGITVLCHDAKLSAGSGGKSLVIARSNFADLMAAKPDLTTLAAALHAVDQKVPVMIEVKAGVDIAPIIQLLNGLLKEGWQPGSIWLGSKSFKLLQALHSAIPQLDTIVIDPWSGVRAGRRARKLGTRRIAMNRRWLWAGFIKAVSHSGNELYAYTVNDPTRAARWATYGLAGVFTDNPNVYKDK